MDFFLFGTPSRSLFGTLHEGAPGGPASGLAVLMCPPWGQESIRTQRMFRVLAERLARSGATVLRFDYFGTGDSGGGDGDVSVAGCCDDIVAAQARLLSACTPRHVVWIGVRLGASFALMASRESRLARRPDHIVAWEPVLDGPAYLEGLRQAHVDALEASYTVPDAAWRKTLQADAAAFRSEAMGFALSDRFQDELATLTTAQLMPAPGLRLSVLMPSGNRGAERIREILAPTAASCEVLALDHDFEWTSEEALNTALVPGPAVQKLFELSMGS